MSLPVGNVAANSRESNYYFALSNAIPPAQTLSLVGNTLALSGGGGSANIANATTVSTSAFKLSAQTYIPGFLTTNFDGRIQATGDIQSIANLGGSVAISGNSSEVQLSGGANVPKVRFGDSNGDEGVISFENDFIRQTSTSISTLQLAGVVLDSFGNPGTAGQQLQSSGAGLPVVWGAGSGVGLTSVVGGTNIVVDSTNPISPIVNVGIKSDLNMNLSTITNCADIELRGSTAGVNFKDTAGADQGDLTYIESNDRLRLQSGNVLINTDNTDQYRIQMGESLGALDVTTLNKPIRLIRNDATNTVVQSRLDLNANSVAIQAAGVTATAATGISLTTEDPLSSDTTDLVMAPLSMILSSSGFGSKLTLNGQAGNTLLQGGQKASIITIDGDDIVRAKVELTDVAETTGSVLIETIGGDINLIAGTTNTLTMTAASSLFDSGAGGADTAFQVLQNGGTAEFTLSAAGGSYTGILSAENGLDLVSALGQVKVTNPDGTWDLFKPAYGNFSSSVSQPASAGGTKLLFNTTGVASDIAIGVGGNTSRIIPAYPGVYKIAYSIQLFKNSVGLSAANVWIARSNSNQANTTRGIRLFDTEAVPISSDFVIQITSGQYIEVILQSTDTTVVALGGAASPPLPATPSIIFTIERIA